MTSTTAPQMNVSACSSPTPSDSTSISAESSKSMLAAPVLKCLAALESAETDSEKLAALFLVPKLVKGSECDSAARIHLMKGIGYSFLARMLRSHDSPEGCPKLMYQSVALAVLSCFASEEEIMTNASILFNVPVLLDIVNDADNEIYEENLLIINDAYTVLAAIAATEKGRQAFISNRGIHCLCEIWINQNFQHEKAAELLLSLLKAAGQPCWGYHTGPDDFNNLMLKCCRDFNEAKDESKFEMCDSLRIIISSFPKAAFDDEDWLPLLQRGLQDILFSKITKAWRDPALKLVAAVIEVSDSDWCLDVPVYSDDASEGSASASGSGGKFFMIILNLACIEVIMHLEEKKLEESVENAELLVACYTIIESAVQTLSNEEKLTHIEDRQRGQLYTALKNAFSTILKFLADVSLELKEDPSKREECEPRYFICATVRVLGAWLSEETMAMREDVYHILPFIVGVAQDTFEEQKVTKLHTLPGKGSSDFSNFTEEAMLEKRRATNAIPDILRFLLPALCHLVAEDKSRQILLDLRLHETLYTYLSFHWSIYDSFKHWLKEQAEAEDDAEVAEPLYMIDNAKFEMINSKYAMATICNVLMNVVVLEPEFVNEDNVFVHLLNFMRNALPSLDDSVFLDTDHLVLYGNLSVLGLLILKQHSHRPKANDAKSIKFLQAVIRFLWDAHNCEETADEASLTVSFNYVDHWADLIDLWFLGMQVMASLLTAVPWICQIILESNWPQELTETLGKVQKDGLEASTRTAFEDLLCSVARSGGEAAIEELKKNDVIAVCQKHGLKELATLISSGGRKKSSNPPAATSSAAAVAATESEAKS